MDPILKEAYDRAFEYESKYGNCSQCVIAGLSDAFSLGLDELFKAAYGLAGGVGKTGWGTCGALSGGALVLGHFYGRDRQQFEKKGFQKSFKLVKELTEKFINKFGGCSCREVQEKIFGRSFNLWDEDDYRKFEEAGAHTDKCPKVTGTVARWIAEMIK